MACLEWQVLLRTAFGLPKNPCKDGPDKINELCEGWQLKNTTSFISQSPFTASWTAVISQLFKPFPLQWQTMPHTINTPQQTALKNRMHHKKHVYSLLPIVIYYTSTPSHDLFFFLLNKIYVIESSIKLSCVQLMIAQFWNSWELLVGDPSVLSSNWSLKWAPSHYMLSLWTLSSVESPYQQWPGLDLAQRLVSIRKAERRRPGKRQQAAGGELQRCCSALPLNSGSVFSLCSLESIWM